MEVEIQDDVLTDVTGPAPLGSLDWSQAAARLQGEGTCSVPANQLRAFVQGWWPLAPNSSALQESARIWVQEFWGQSSLPLQIQAAFELQRWLSPQLSDAQNDHLRAMTGALVIAISEFDEERRKAHDARQSRLVLVGQLFASIAHELRNPLAVMESSVFLLRRQLQDDDGATRHLHKITRNVTRCHEIIHEVLEMIRDAPLRTQRLSVIEIWNDVQAHCPENDAVHWRIEAPESLVVSCEPRLLRQCLLNLVANAQVAMNGRGELRCVSYSGEAGGVVFEVLDSGPGFSRESLSQGVQCLVSGHSEGHGLGLALAQSIAVRHGGALKLSNRSEGGACVRVTIPSGQAQ